MISGGSRQQKGITILLFFELKTGADTCTAYYQTDTYIACGTDRIDFESTGKTKSLFVSCTEIEEGGVEGCDQLVAKDLKIKLLQISDLYLDTKNTIVLCDKIPYIKYKDIYGTYTR